MRRELTEKYDRRVPRYTSYPTAPHFATSVDDAVYRSWLGDLDRSTPASLYLHVPFCAALCWYCGCHTTVVNGYRPIAEYAGLLEREIELVGEAIGDAIPIRAIHWGGGTPNMLESANLSTLSSYLERSFHIAGDAEISVELDPRVLSLDQVRDLVAVGVNRVSLGVQDFDDDVQRAINRVQPYEMTAQAVDWLRSSGLRGINFDLLYGLPRQTVASVVQTIDRAVALEPDRIALFGYAHVPWMKKHQRLIDEASLPGMDDRLAQHDAASARLVGHGYVRVGLDHFARSDDTLARHLDDGRLHRNFQGYTTDDSPALIGLGLSSIGSLPQGYVQNTTEFPAYRERIASGRLATVRGVAISDEDRLRRAVIERLMCDLRVDLTDIARRHGRAPDHFAQEWQALDPLVTDGIAERRAGEIVVTEEGRHLVRAVCAVFDTYLDRDGARHSRVV